MELRFFFSLFFQRRRFVVGALLVGVVLGAVSYRLQDQWYRGEVLLSIARTGSDATPDYRYDQWYRLQADEMMAETVASLLETKRSGQSIAERAKLSGESAHYFLEGEVEAYLLSAELIRVLYRSRTVSEAERISAALLGFSEAYVTGLNERSRDTNWFILLPSGTLIEDGRFSFWRGILGGLLVGLAVAFAGVLVAHYWFGTPIKKAPGLVES